MVYNIYHRFIENFVINNGVTQICEELFKQLSLKREPILAILYLIMTCSEFTSVFKMNLEAPDKNTLQFFCYSRLQGDIGP